MPLHIDSLFQTTLAGIVSQTQPILDASCVLFEPDDIAVMAPIAVFDNRDIGQKHAIAMSATDHCTNLIAQEIGGGVAVIDIARFVEVNPRYTYGLI